MPTNDPGARTAELLTGAVRSSAAPQDLLVHLSHQQGPLTSPLVGTVLAVIAAVLTLLLLRRVRRAGGVARMGRGRITARTTSVVGMVALATAAYVNAYAGYLPTPGSLAQAAGLSTVAAAGVSGPARTVDAGQVSAIRITAPRLGITDGTTYVYTPPGYTHSPARRYPVIYLIPGSPGTPADWFRAGRADLVVDSLVRAHAMPPAIVVAMNTAAGLTGDTESLNVVGGPQVETYYTRVVVPYVDAHYRTVPDRAHRVIGGMSSGGFAALNVGLHHLDLYATILAFEPYGDPGPGNLRRLLGGDVAQYLANSPRHYIPTMAFPEPVSVFLDVGGATGHDVTNVRALAAQLAARGQQVELRIEPGQHHTWIEAATGLPYGLAFAFPHLPDTPA
ncbi:esterase family protein [Georgenia sp. SYP-B2076]|uniref:alpha/beta hydrolase n=1 Tax=Georgenia sp. SYP-B2076 TaxID=2495881 RepID=UPI0013DF828E|nr:alpha/beta hydrolase-fold protein [Georgenia sp. SYP-B2076]